MKNTLDIFNLNLKAFGLDISDQALKLVELEKKKKNQIKIRCLNETSLKDDVIKRGVVLKPDVLASSIKELIKKTKGLNTKYVVLSLPEEKAFLQVITMPRMKEEELKNAVKYEAENYIPFSIEKMYLDCESISSELKKDTQEVLLAALQKETVDSYLGVLDLAGLIPLVLETESQAITRSLISNRKDRSPRMIMDIGASRTIFIISAGATPRFSASIPLSGNVLTEAVSKTLKIDFKKADELKRNCGLKRKTDKEKEVFDALIPAMVDLTEQMKKHIEYYHDYAQEKGFAEKDIKEVLVCGGGGNLIDLDKFLSEQLNLPVKIGNPFVNIPNHKQFTENELSFTVAIGLALRGLEEHD
ncbi:MAG: type IV pilus assembly protein PilM [Candidatus Paceibacterota bacterium]